MEIRYIGWFFQFVWQCIKDLRTPIDCINEVALFKENWSDFKTRIYFVTNPEAIAITKSLEQQLEEYKPSKKILTSFANKMINDKFYTTIKITGEGNKPSLTEEEFKAGKQGYVWMDNKTGKIIF